MPFCSLLAIVCSKLHKLSRSNPQGSETREHPNRFAELRDQNNRFRIEYCLGKRSSIFTRKQ
jgi:hypothetical protein